MDSHKIDNTCVTAYELQRFANMGLPPAKCKKHKLSYRKSQANGIDIYKIINTLDKEGGHNIDL